MEGTIQNENKLIGTVSSNGTLKGGVATVYGKDGKDGYSIYQHRGNLIDGSVGYTFLTLSPNSIVTGGKTLQLNDFVIVDTYLYKIVEISPYSGNVTAALVVNLKGDKGDKGEQGIQGEKGEKGDKGDKGADGTTTFEDLTDEQKATLKGDKGDAFTYEDFTAEQLESLNGKDGYSIYQYTSTVSSTGNTTLFLNYDYIATGENALKINDFVLVETYLYKTKSVNMTAKVVTVELVTNLKGEQGAAGAIEFIVVNELPTESINTSAIYMRPVGNPSDTNTYEEFIYVNGVWESLGTASVEVDLTGYVKNTDYATQTTGGAIKVNKYNGLQMVGTDSDTIAILPASEAEISAKSNGYRPIVPKRLDYAVKSALASNTITLTDAEKASAQAWLGLTAEAWTFTLEDGSTVTKTVVLK